METLVHELRREHARQIEGLNTRFLEYRLRNEQAERIVNRVDAIEKTLDAALQETRSDCVDSIRARRRANSLTLPP